MEKQRLNKPLIFKKDIRRILLVFGAILCHINTNAQLYINGDMLVQVGETLFASDSITLGSNQSLVVHGILHSTKGVNTNGNFIQTLNGGSIISPVASGVSKSFDIGTNSNNRIQILQNSGSTVNYKLNVSDNVYTNPQTKTTIINSNVINKTWLVQPLTTSNNTTISLFWNAPDELIGFNRTNCAISKWQENSTTSWSFTTASSTSQVTGSSPSYSKTINTGNLANTNYYFGVGGNGSSLPVTLLNFQAANNNENVVLDWTTSTEINNSHFEVQRSTDNKNWNLIATVNGSGNTQTPMRYSFTDQNPYSILNVNELFYRLKQVDFDENYSFSTSQNVNRNETELATEVSIYPNPTTNKIWVNIQNQKSSHYLIEVIDIYGNTIKRSLLNSSNTTVDLSDIASGIYFIKVFENETQNLISTNKIFKN